MSQQDKNRELIVELYRCIDAMDAERCRQLVSAACKPQLAGNAMDIEAWIAMGKIFMITLSQWCRAGPTGALSHQQVPARQTEWI